jgi:serine protease AprX
MPRLAVIALGALLGLLVPAPGGMGEYDLVRVIVQPSDDERFAGLVQSLGGTRIRRLDRVGVVVFDLPADRLAVLRAAPGVRSVSADRPMRAALDRTADVVGARWVHDYLGFDGSGIGVAIIDSGVARSHPDLDPGRLVHFVDFVRYEPQPYDGYGHGTHVAGIIAAGGSFSNGGSRGIAPGAHLVVLKTLDHEGRGYISDAIAAIDYAIEQRAVFNIRVINLSVTAGVYESYRTDPLALAAARAVDAGIVVVTAAGNLGRGPTGEVQHGGVTAPGNAPWVLTVGAADYGASAGRTGEVVAPFSSLGPSSIDHVEKPDLIAPGTDMVSLADPHSTLFLTRPGSRRWGAAASADVPYLSLSGTSMAAPVVAGGVAVMLQANGALSPSAVKAILRATADPLEGYSPLAQGAGLLNLRTAVAVAARMDDPARSGGIQHE